MKPPKQRQRSTKDRVVVPTPDGIILDEIAKVVRYTGSVYHKTTASFTGQIPRPRPDATICPDELAGRQADIQKWLRNAILNGHFGADWRQGFPHHVWHREGDTIFEASITNTGLGEYHGYPLESDAEVRGLP